MPKLYMLENCPECCELKMLLWEVLGDEKCSKAILKLLKNQIEGIEVVYYLNSDEARDGLDAVGFPDDFTPLLVEDDGTTLKTPEDIAVRVLPFLQDAIE